jgi:hypothetical protein
MSLSLKTNQTYTPYLLLIELITDIGEHRVRTLPTEAEQLPHGDGEGPDVAARRHAALGNCNLALISIIDYHL